MGQVISVAQEKGGSGKSTILMLLAARIIKDGAKVLIVDVDPQLTAYKWAVKSEKNHDLAVDYAKISADTPEKILPGLEKYKGHYDFVFVDTAGIESQALFFVFMKSDLVLVPTKASAPDVQGMKKTYEKALQVIQGCSLETPIYAVLSDIDKGTKMTQSIRDYILDNNIPCLNKTIAHKTKIKEFLTNGGYPEGNALSEASGLLADLQTRELLDFYKV